MKIVGQRGLEPVTLNDVTAVVVTSDAGTPLAVVSEYLPGCFSLKHAREEGFDRVLDVLGFRLLRAHVDTVEGPRIGDV